MRRVSRTEIGLFPDEAGFLAAARECRRRGVDLLDARTPYPVHGLEKILGLRPTRLPRVTFIGGALGLAVALYFQYWSSSIDYPLNVGGKPFDSLPAFLPVAFEVLVLFAGLLTVAAFLVRARLLPGKKAPELDSRITDDRFALIVNRKDAAVELAEVHEIFRRHGALGCWSEVEE